MTRYYGRRWAEVRGDANDAWGHSWWFFVVVDGYAVRQIERYDNGPDLVYDTTRREDRYGGLTHVEFDRVEWAQYEIDGATFERDSGGGRV